MDGVVAAGKRVDIHYIVAIQTIRSELKRRTGGRFGVTERILAGSMDDLEVLLLTNKDGNFALMHLVVINAHREALFLRRSRNIILVYL